MITIMVCQLPDALALTDYEFMAQLRIELQLAANLSDKQIAAYTEDEAAWLAYKADGYSPLEAVEADMEHWD
jgi:hypothetical protein